MTVTDTSPLRQPAEDASSLPAERRHRRVGPLALGQLVVIEVAVIGVLATLGRPLVVPIVAGAVAAIAVGLVLARKNKLWWFEYLTLRRGLRRRAAAAAKAGVRAPALVQMAPDLTIVQASDRGTRFGVGRDAGGWFVALEVRPGADAAGDVIPAVTVDRIAQALTETMVPVSAVQIVAHVVPASAPALPRSAACVASYQDLQAGASIPAQARVWVAVRLNPADAASAASSRGGGPRGVHHALAAVSARVVKMLNAADLEGVPLSAAGLLAAVSMSAGLGDLRGAGDADRPAVHEEWTAFHVPGAVHVGFEAAHVNMAALSGALHRLPRLTVATTVSVVLTVAGADDVRVQALVDITAAPKTVEDTVRNTTDTFRSWGVPLRRLDGRHAAAVYATAPTGGVLP